jgi:uncharacterized membrane protein YtjA (UPF0391 family)
MKKYRPVLEDIATFVSIALAAALFGFLGLSGTVAILGKVVFTVSLALAVLLPSLTLRRKSH